MGALLDAFILAHLENPIPAARMKQTNAQSIPNATDVALNFDIVEYDTTGSQIANLSTNRLTASRTGIWVISTSIRYVGTTGTGERYISIWRNAVGSDRLCEDDQYPPANTYNSVHCSTVVRLVAGDFVSSHPFQTSGGAINTDPEFADVSFQMAWLGPA